MSGIMNMFVAAKTTIATAVDAFFNSVTLLLNTSNTNGAQNNTFLDSSTNNFSITRNGNTTQGTFTPFSQTGWSNYVGATSQYLTVTSQPLINVNDWTVEFWMYPTQYNNNGGIFGASNGGGTNPKLYLYVTGANLIIEGYSGGFFTALSTAQPTLNQWTYVSVSRSSSTGNAYIYYNGVLQGSAAAVPAITGITGGFSLFSNGEGSSAGFYGYMSNMRVSDIARYTGSSYSVPTAPSTAIANTTLLTAQSNRYVDNSTNGYAIAVTGTPSVQAFSPFLPTAAYDASVVGGSAYFDGTGDFLTTSSSSAFNLSSGDWTIEGWFWLNSNGDDTRLFTVVNSSTDMYGAFVRSGTVRLGKIGLSDAAFTTINLNSWNHIAFCKTSTSTITCYINGVSGGSTTTYTFPNADCTVYIAASPANYALSSTNGYISNFRVVKGTAVYTANFTPPTAPLTAITNTSLLLSCTNSGIFDSAAKNVLETVGNAQVSTTVAKWGTTSMYFAGSPNYLQLSNPNANVQLGSGNFTIEMWVNFSSAAGTQVLNNYGYEGGSTNYSYLFYYSSNTIRFGNSTDGSAGTSQDNSLGAFTPTAGTWYHLALVRNGTTVTCYVDGTALSAPYNIAARTIFFPGNASTFTLGANGGNYFSGYIDDFRLTKGYARYTANFTSPAAAFPLQ